MGCDEWMADLLRDMRPFIQEAHLPQVQATAAAMGIYAPVSPTQPHEGRGSRSGRQAPLLRVVPRPTLA